MIIEAQTQLNYATAVLLQRHHHYWSDYTMIDTLYYKIQLNSTE